MRRPVPGSDARARSNATLSGPPDTATTIPSGPTPSRRSDCSTAATSGVVTLTMTSGGKLLQSLGANAGEIRILIRSTSWQLVLLGLHSQTGTMDSPSPSFLRSLQLTLVSPRVWQFVRRPRTRYLLSWFCAVVAMTVIILAAWHAEDDAERHDYGP